MLQRGYPIYNNHVPKDFVVEEGKLKGMTFEKVEAEYDDEGKRRWCPPEKIWCLWRPTMC